MSGICGIVNLDGAPADRGLLQAMTSFMTFRGPDAQNVWVDGPVGFGHTLLRTTFESEREQQPCSLDGRVWITADARIDGRDELKSKLRAAHVRDLADATDVELILHAYHAWGTDCVQHLIGDFVFAIWDEPKQRLYCARDHFGIKPFFYARMDQCLIFSNTLNCVRQHPAVSATLNDLAIADFLLFDSNQNPATTTFADIQRLPSAHVMTWFPGSGVQLSRYWCLPTDLGVRHRPAGDYVEHFKELLDIAVADRLRTNRIGVEMSGGLDSSSIAAVALGILSRQAQPFELQAQTIVYDQLIPDQERHFSGLVAQHLGIPIHYIAADKYQLYERWNQLETWSPEPSHNPHAALHVDAFRGAAALSRVFLAGWDGDALLSESLRPHFRSLLNNCHYGRLLMAMVRYATLQRGDLPRALRNGLRRNHESVASASMSGAGYPDWLNPELETRFELRKRWHQYHAMPSVDHPTRPYAYSIYEYVTQHPGFFDWYDAGCTGLALEYRHPFMDLRLLDYCLSLPLQPWLVKKHILRAAMDGLLPEVVRTRPKTPLAGLPYMELLKRPKLGSFDHLRVTTNHCRYINAAKLQLDKILCNNANACWSAMRPLSLQVWLDGLALVPRRDY